MNRAIVSRKGLSAFHAGVRAISLARYNRVSAFLRAHFVCADATAKAVEQWAPGLLEFRPEDGVETIHAIDRQLLDSIVAAVASAAEADVIEGQEDLVFAASLCEALAEGPYVLRLNPAQGRRNSEAVATEMGALDDSEERFELFSKALFPQRLAAQLRPRDSV